VLREIISGATDLSKRLLASVLCTFVLSCAAVFFWTSTGETQTAKPSVRPRLVILIIIDQFRNDYLDRFRPHFVAGGFNRLMSGARFTTCRYDYAVTATGPGHASIATGTYPSNHGIIENAWYDRELKRPANCVEDGSTRIVDSAQGPSEKRGASPHFLLGTPLGIELPIQGGFNLSERPRGYPARRPYRQRRLLVPGIDRKVRFEHLLHACPPKLGGRV
jgi:hypothetical protein